MHYNLFVLYTVITGESVVHIGSGIPMPNCSHEEADTRMIVHLYHALAQGAKTIKVHTVDTDVIVILVGKYHHILTNYPQTDIWVAFGKGDYFCLKSISTICTTLGEDMSKALPIFHALTGCDTTSTFFGKGKKSAWKAWKAYKDVTNAFLFLAQNPFQQLDKDSEVFKKIERFTVLTYSLKSSLSSVNEARLTLFCQNSQTMERLPPTQVRQIMDHKFKIPL